MAVFPKSIIRIIEGNNTSDSDLKELGLIILLRRPECILTCIDDADEIDEAIDSISYMLEEHPDIENALVVENLRPAEFLRRLVNELIRATNKDIFLENNTTEAMPIEAVKKALGVEVTEEVVSSDNAGGEEFYNQDVEVEEPKTSSIPESIFNVENHREEEPQYSEPTRKVAPANPESPKLPQSLDSKVESRAMPMQAQECNSSKVLEAVNEVREQMSNMMEVMMIINQKADMLSAENHTIDNNVLTGMSRIPDEFPKMFTTTREEISAIKNAVSNINAITSKQESKYGEVTDEELSRFAGDIDFYDATMFKKAIVTVLEDVISGNTKMTAEDIDGVLKLLRLTYGKLKVMK